MKIFSSVRDTQRGSELHEEEEREEGDRGEQDEKKGDSRGERQISRQYSVPRVSSVAQTPTEFHRIGLGREGERQI